MVLVVLTGACLGLLEGKMVLSGVISPDQLGLFPLGLFPFLAIVFILGTLGGWIVWKLEPINAENIEANTDSD
jgi:hypothetical protein